MINTHNRYTSVNFRNFDIFPTNLLQENLPYFDTAKRKADLVCKGFLLSIYISTAFFKYKPWILIFYEQISIMVRTVSTATRQAVPWDTFAPVCSAS
jgi:hypothetical protein